MGMHMIIVFMFFSYILVSHPYATTEAFLTVNSLGIKIICTEDKISKKY